MSHYICRLHSGAALVPDSSVIINVVETERYTMLTMTRRCCGWVAMVVCEYNKTVTYLLIVSIVGTL